MKSYGICLSLTGLFHLAKYSLYTMDYYSAIRKKEILHFATAWMDLMVSFKARKFFIFSEVQFSRFFFVAFAFDVTS